jgi:electron-transferring-flavoprotein dehydrogenase
MGNHGNYIISLGNLCRWLGEQAEALGVEIYPGFAAAEVLYHEDGSVKGVATGDMGIGKDGQPNPQLPAGHGTARARPSSPKAAAAADQAAVQQVQPARRRRSANLRHRHQGTVGNRPGQAPARAWSSTPSAGRCFRHLRRLLPLSPGNNLVAVGFVVGLDYKNPYLSPYEEFQRYKTHPEIRPSSKAASAFPTAPARCRKAAAVAAQADLPGRLLIGDDAGFLNVPKIKGTHMPR